MRWAQRLKRVFRIDIEPCERCGGQVRVIASIEDPAVVGRILSQLQERAGASSVPAEADTVHRPRGSPASRRAATLAATGLNVLFPESGLTMAGELEKKIHELGVDNVAAFIGEPVQGAGGVIIPPDTYWPEIQRICDEYGILLVADEVITGFGRLGEWFGSQHYDIEPDLIIFARAVNGGYLPLGGVLVGERVAEALIDEGGEYYRGFTHSGNPVSCAVAIATLGVMRREGIVERVREEIAPCFAQGWRASPIIRWRARRARSA